MAQSGRDRKRYSRKPFPAYRYVPGKAPHPTRDPDGHSWNAPDDKPGQFAAADWVHCESYLYGIDLFNHEYWWEAHEALEAVWIAAGRHTETGLFIQGLIQIAVAQLKQHQGFTDVAARMARAGLDKMGPVRGYFAGIDTEQLRRDVAAWLEGERDRHITIELDCNSERGVKI